MRDEMECVTGLYIVFALTLQDDRIHNIILLAWLKINTDSFSFRQAGREREIVPFQITILIISLYLSVSLTLLHFHSMPNFHTNY
jgi:hypothetical protein